MNPGSSLTEIAEELSDLRNNKQDLLVHEHILSTDRDGEQETLGSGAIQLVLPSSTDDKIPRFVGINTLAHRQIATHLEIPQKYYDRCHASAPHLLSRNINHWFAQADNSVRMLRLHKGNCRAFLSNRYRPLDNFDLAEAVLPQLQDKFEIRSCKLTETHLYIKAISLDLPAREVEVGDLIRIGVWIRNSDVGCSSLSIAPFIERLVCKNGYTVNDLMSRQRHVGSRNNGFGNELVTEFLSDEAKQADDKAFWLTVRDTVAACAKEATLDRVIDTMREAKDIPMRGNPVEIIHNIGRNVGLRQAEEGCILEHLAGGGDLSAYGLSNAITRQAEDTPDYDRASELEQIGWQVLRLPSQSFSLN